MMNLRYWLLILISLQIALAQPQSPNVTKPSTAQNFEGGVVIKHWEPPEYTPELRAAKVEGEVSISFIVERDGSLSDLQVKKSRDPRLNDLALSTLKKWVIEPAVSEGKAIRADCEQIIVFRLETPKRSDLPLAPPLPMKLAKRTPSKGLNMPMPDYPEELSQWAFRGSVLFELDVTEDGKAANPRVLSASHPAFVAPALESLNKWTFQPAKQGRIPFVEKVRIPMEYDYPMSSRKEQLERNGIGGSGGTELKASMGLPLIVVRYEPVYPFDALFQGRSGKAVVEFTVDGGGVVTDAELIEASEPEFGSSLLSSVNLWMFEPAISEGKGMSVRLRATYQFEPPPSDEQQSAVRRLLNLRKSQAGIPSLKDLDKKLRPLYRMAPQNPSKVQMQEKVELALPVVIDREGRVRLVEMRPESNTPFGWAAAQAISNWVFEPPVAKGQVTDVRVVVPFTFVP